MRWHEVYQRLSRYAEAHKCNPPRPPKLLILAGWAYSNDVEKMERWEATIQWAAGNDCIELVSGIPDSDFYFTEEPSQYAVGPMGGPMYRPWDFEEKVCPPQELLKKSLETISTQWSEIVGLELAGVTRPINFTGRKARRLVVQVDAASRPPWGDWASRSRLEAKRRTFTEFRAAVNRAITPHEVDHIDFVIDEVTK